MLNVDLGEVLHVTFIVIHLHSIYSAVFMTSLYRSHSIALIDDCSFHYFACLFTVDGDN